MPPRSTLIRIALLLPFLAYLPINAVLWQFGIVDAALIDFGAYYQAGLRFLQGYPLYELSSALDASLPEFGADLRYLYPPVIVLLFVPLTLFPPIIAGIIWIIATLSFLLLSVWLLTGTFEGAWSRRERILLCVLVASFGPTLTWIKHGQVSGLLAGSMCLSVYLIRRQGGVNTLAGGALTAFAGFIKPAYLAFGAYLVLDDRRLAGAVLGVLGFIGLNLLFGPDTVLAYIEVLQQGKGWGIDRLPPSEWNAGRFQPFNWLGIGKFVVIGFLILGTAALSFYARRKTVSDIYIMALGAAMVPLVHPVTNALALNALIPAFILLASYERKIEGEVPLTLFISALLIHIHPYIIEFLAKVGPTIIPELQAITPAIPFLQPALYGSIVLVSFTVSKILQ